MSLRILFYKDPPPLQSTMLTWGLAQEMILRGHFVDFGREISDKIPYGYYDWIYSGGDDTWNAINLARQTGAKVHIHSEGVETWRVGLESAKKYGYPNDCSTEEIKWWREKYASWMSGMYEADTSSLNGSNQFEPLEDLLGGKKLTNCYMRSCGSDWRFARSLPAVEKEGYMVTVSRLEPNKRVMMVAQALAMLDPEKLPMWQIVGYGSKPQIDQLVSFCQERKIKFRIRQCYGAEKWVRIKKARIMLSGYTGIPPGEGLLCDIPVLSMDHIDIEEQYRGAIYFARDVDVEDYAFQVETLLSLGNFELTEKTRRGKQHLIAGYLYGCTQETSAYRLEQIFLGEYTEKWR